MTIEERLDQGEALVLDGAMGTELERRGVPMHHVAWSATAVLTHPEVVRSVHEDYLRAGAEILITNTFATSRHVLEPAGLGDKVQWLNHRAVALAREACDRAAGERPVWIAGSISSFVAGADVRQTPPPHEAKASYCEQCELLAEAGVDLLVLEMLRDTEQSVIAIEAAEQTGLLVWAGFTCKLAEDGTTVVLRGRDVETPFAEALEPVLAAGGSVVAVMHTDMDVVEPALRIVFDRWSGPVAAYPHSGDFVMPNWRFVDIISPDDFAAAAQGWIQMGVQVVGGCCGIGPEHIERLSARLPKQSSTDQSPS